MTAEEFDKLLVAQLELTRDILGVKAKEYATSDRLHNFKIAAELQGFTPMEALAGMMAKHTVSVYDMATSGDIYPLAQWEEKITDHINYLILLKAIAIEEGSV